MRRFLLILFAVHFIVPGVRCQTFTVNELVILANMPSKDINVYLKKKGYELYKSSSDSTLSTATFIIERNKSAKKNKFVNENSLPEKSIGICFRPDTKNFTLQTVSVTEYNLGEQSLIKSGFIYDTLKDVANRHSMLFQKGNITIEAVATMQDSIPQYSFILKQKVIPATLRYAEDLLQFDSHEFLVSYFGAPNVKKDMYYLTDVELKKCSVLYSGTSRQVVFVWDEDIYLNKLLYIIVTNKLPTKGGEESDPLPGNNQWQLKNGVYPGMALKDLLKINEVDFDIYGNKSELAFLIKPNELGKINFKKTAIMLTCHGCNDDKIFNQKVVSALDVARANLPMRVFDVVIYATSR